MNRIILLAMSCLLLVACSGVQERPEGFPEAAFKTWQDRYPEGEFNAYKITTPGDGTQQTCMLAVEEGNGTRYLTMYADGGIIEDRYVEELHADELPDKVALTISREYPEGEVESARLIVRNDTTEYLVSVQLPDKDESPKYNYYDNLVLSGKGDVKKRTNVATTD